MTPGMDARASPGYVTTLADSMAAVTRIVWRKEPRRAPAERSKREKNVGEWG